MALKDYYQLLEIPPTAPADEVKRAFRLQIARYHPDKVQHLGKEFQAMAAERAAELTEAYRILSDEGRRAEYDRASRRVRRPARRGAAAAAAPGCRADAQPAAGPLRRRSEPRAAAADGPAVPAGAREPRRVRPQGHHQPRAAGARGGRRRLRRDAGARVRHRVRAEKQAVRRAARNPRLLGRFVSRVDREAVADAWTRRRNGADPPRRTRCACC